MGGVETVAAAVRADLAARLPSQNKKQREGLALLVATALDVRSVNLMELAAALPRAAERLDMRYQWISRLLGNPLIDTDAVMAPFAREVLARAGAAPGLAREEDPRCDRLRRAARGAPGGRASSARGGASHVDGGSVLRLARVDRVVPGAGLGLAAAAQAGSARVRGRRRDHAGGVLRARRASVAGHRTDRATRPHPCRHGA